MAGLRAKQRAGIRLGAIEKRRLRHSDRDLQRAIGRMQHVTAGRSAGEAPHFDALVPYHELFADVVAVIFAGDPKALLPTTTRAEFRDFTTEQTIADWRSTDVSCAFAPLRGILWREWLSRAEVRAHPSALLRALALAILNQSRAHRANPLHWQTAENVPAANHDLLASLRSHLQSCPRAVAALDRSQGA